MAGQGSTGKAEFDFWRGCCHAVTMNELRVTLTGKLVGAQELLNEPFSDECRPTLRYCGRRLKRRRFHIFGLGTWCIFDAEKVCANSRRLHHFLFPQTIKGGSGRGIVCHDELMAGRIDG